VQSSADNWRINYWFWFAFSCASLVLAVICLLPAQRPQDPAIRILARAYADMAISFLTPAIFWTLLVNAVLFGGLVALSLTYAQKLQSPPWYFGSASVGTVQVGAVIGSVLSFLLTSTLVDRLASVFTRRNNGIHEPEHLLPSFILPTLLAFAGLVVYGIVGGNPEKYQWVGVHSAFALYYCGFVALSAVTSIWVAEVSPRRAGAAIVLVCGGRNAASFGIR
jgi:hypothetical protein